MSETIGTKLEAGRTARGLSIEDIAHKTRIHRDVLCQLESDDYSKFPNLMFLKSFLNLYSQHVGVDASETIATLNAQATRHGEQYLLGGVDPELRERYGHLTSRIPVRPILASLAALALIAVGGDYLVSRLYAIETNLEADARFPAPDLEDLAPKETVDVPPIALASPNPEPAELGVIESRFVSSPAGQVPRAIPKVVAPVADEFEIEAKLPIDPDIIPKAARVVRTVEPSTPASRDESEVEKNGGDEEREGVEIPSGGTEPAVDISTVGE